MRKRRRTYLMVAALSVMGLLAGACGDGAADQSDGPDITVGSFNFAESQILAHAYAMALEDAGYPTETRLNVGSREVVQPAMQRGDLDLIIEYSGNALRFQRRGEDIGIHEPQEVYDALQAEYEDDGLVTLGMSDAQNVDGLAVTRATAEEHDLSAISDIEDFPGVFRFGAGPECPERLSCLRGYREIYGFTEEEFTFVSLDVAGPITVEALRTGEVDGANLFTTQGVIGAHDFVLLDDDRGMQLPQNLVPVTRQEIVDAYGQELVDLVDGITIRLTEDLLIELNRRVEVDQEDPDHVAEDWLREEGLIE